MRKRLLELCLLILAGACSRSHRLEAGWEERLVWEEISVKQGDTFSQLVESWELPSPSRLLKVLAENKHPQLRSGERLRLHRSPGPVSVLRALEFPLSPRQSIVYSYRGTEWSYQEIEKNFDERQRSFSGTVRNTLWESALEAQMDTQLLLRLTEIFAWVIDFSREIRVGDEWRLVATQYIEEGYHRGWKDITVAEFRRGNEIYQAFLFEDPVTGRRGYFTANGESLERVFLKSPIKFGRISSRFQKRRFHPVLQVSRPHLGVDYSAPTGTPIMAVGDGTVTFAAWNGGGGRVIKVRHNETYSTAYKHLSRFAKNLKVGRKVHQGEIIGYVGSTGLSTGPHLHFEFLKNGVFVDPNGLKFPSATPLEAAQIQVFKRSIASSYALIPKWPSESPLPPLLNTVQALTIEN